MSIDYVAVLADQSALFDAAAGRPGALGQPVPACPGWTVADLVEHLGEVQVFWAHVVRAAGEPLDEDAVAVAKKPTEDLLGWARQASVELVTALRETPAHTSTWCWWNADERASAADVACRQAHEALIHRWDAEAAVGNLTPAPPPLWADGIDEFAQRFLHGGPWSGPSGVIALLADDVGREWRFGVGEASPRDGGRPVRLRDKRMREVDARVTGTAEQLDLMLWRRRRIEVDAEHVNGDTALIQAFVRWPGLD